MLCCDNTQVTQRNATPIVSCCEPALRQQLHEVLALDFISRPNRMCSHHHTEDAYGHCTQSGVGISNEMVNKFAFI